MLLIIIAIVIFYYKYVDKQNKLDCMAMAQFDQQMKHNSLGSLGSIYTIYKPHDVTKNKEDVKLLEWDGTK